MPATEPTTAVVHPPTTAGAVRETVVTVTGEIAPEALGAVLPREHLLGDFAPPHDTPESWAATGRIRPTSAERLRLYRAPLTMDLLGEVGMGVPNRDDWLLDEEGLAVAEVAALRQAGGGTLVDHTTAPLARRPAGLRRIAEASGVNVVMGSGCRRPARSGAPVRDEADRLADEIVRDIAEGVEGVRAGIIGALAPPDLHEPAERAVLVAAARASAATGAALTIDRSADPADQQRVLDLIAEQGADLTRVAVGHCDALAPQPDRLEPILQRGVFVQFDQLGRLPSVFSVCDDQDVAAAVLDLARRGRDGRVLLSQGVRAKSHLLAYGGGGYGYILEQFIPYLRVLGADDALVETVTVTNPRRLLTITTPRTDR